MKLPVSYLQISDAPVNGGALTLLILPATASNTRFVARMTTHDKAFGRVGRIKKPSMRLLTACHQSLSRIYAETVVGGWDLKDADGTVAEYDQTEMAAMFMEYRSMLQLAVETAARPENFNWSDLHEIDLAPSKVAA